MTFYEDLVTQTQMNFERYYDVYARGGAPYELADPSPLSYDEQIERLVREVEEADCVLVGGASGLSAAGGGDFYYGDTPSFRAHFGKFAEKYGIKGAFDGSFRQWETPEEKWAYLSTFLYTTQTAPMRQPYLDLDGLLAGKDFFRPHHQSGYAVCEAVSGREGGRDSGRSPLLPMRALLHG